MRGEDIWTSSAKIKRIRIIVWWFRRNILLKPVQLLLRFGENRRSTAGEERRLIPWDRWSLPATRLPFCETREQKDTRDREKRNRPLITHVRPPFLRFFAATLRCFQPRLLPFFLAPFFPFTNTARHNGNRAIFARPFIFSRLSHQLLFHRWWTRVERQSIATTSMLLCFNFILSIEISNWQTEIRDTFRSRMFFFFLIRRDIR